MDYKYINQLLQKYWECQTTLEEEKILKTFFSQEDIPIELLPYKQLFAYEKNEKDTEPLGAEFDKKIMQIVGDEESKVETKYNNTRRRIIPLFRAAAVVAIFLTLGNAAQVMFNNDSHNATTVYGYEKIEKGNSVAYGDSTTTDSMKKASIEHAETTIIK